MTQVAGVALGVAVVVFVLVLLFRSSTTEQETRSRQLVSSSEAVITFQPELSILLAIEAVRLAPTEESQKALVSALQQSHLQTVIRVGAPVYCARFSPDAKRIVTASGDESKAVAQVWQQGGAANWQSVLTLGGYSGRVSAAVFSPRDALIATSSYDGTTLFWDAVSGAVVGPRPRPTYSSLQDIAWSPDGAVVATASMADNLVYLWDVKTKQVFKTLAGATNDVMSVAFSPDGKYLAAGSRDKRTRIWDTQTWAEVGPPLAEHSGEVWSVRFSWDSKFLVTAGQDTTALIWRTSDWQRVNVLGGHKNSINKAAFSPDGRLVATASEDGTAIIWDVSTSKQLGVLQGSLNSVYDVSFSPDGKLILTGSADGTARLWEANVELNPNISGTDLINLACARVTRNMTEEEWQRFMGSEAYRLTCPAIQAR